MLFFLDPKTGETKLQDKKLNEQWSRITEDGQLRNILVERFRPVESNTKGPKTGNLDRFFSVPVQENLGSLSRVPTSNSVSSNLTRRFSRDKIVTHDVEAKEESFQGMKALNATLSEIEALDKTIGQFESHTLIQPDSPLSIWHHSSFVDQNNLRYNCVGQFLLAEKYRKLDWPDLVKAIMDAETEADLKDLDLEYGQQVPPQLLEKLWVGEPQRKALVEGLEDSFLQPENREKLNTLLLTQGSLIDASDDTKYGAEQNILGKALSQLRDKILAENLKVNPNFLDELRKNLSKSTG